MTLFEYRAFNEKGKRVRGTITAANRPAALRQLGARALYPKDLQAVASSPARAGRFLRRRLFFGRAGAREAATALRHLATLVFSGLPIPEGLRTVDAQLRRGGLQRVYRRMGERVREGSPLSAAMAEHPAVFSDIHVNMVRAGEDSGALGTVLQQLAEVTEADARRRKKTAAALTYPVFLVLVGGIILVFLMQFVMPKIIGIFQGMNMALPWSTRALIRLSEMLRDGWWMGLAGGLLAGGGFRCWRKSVRGAMAWDRIRLRFPGLGRMHRQAVMARFFRTLSTLLRSGMPLVPALEIAQSATGNRAAAQTIDRVRRQVADGAGFASALQQCGAFSLLAVQIVRAGESSGALDDMTARVADVFEEDLQAAVHACMSLVEPLIILVMGGIVGFIVLAVLLPIFDMPAGIR